MLQRPIDTRQRMVGWTSWNTRDWLADKLDHRANCFNYQYKC